MNPTDQQKAKEAVGAHAASLVKNGMRLGLGTGSTTACAIEAIGRRVRDEGLNVIGVPTSFAAERRARHWKIPLATLDELDRLDLALDGADEVDPQLNLIKGGGAAHTREKIVAALADRFIVLADPTKEVDKLGTTRALPVEVLPLAATPVERALQGMGAETEIRTGSGKDGPVVTDQGFWIIDATFPGGIASPQLLDERILQIPGVLDHGLFIGMATSVLIAEPAGTVRTLGAAL